MSILRYASPQSRYYQADRDILNDYDNRIDLYNTALKQYRTDAGSYQTKVDAFNETVNTYNSDRDAWKQKAEAYNTAVADWNATGRTTPYNEWSGTVATPGEWFATAPVFEGGGAPVAPNDPGFGQTNVDTFLKQADGRAIRRGNTAATAQQVMTSPGQYYVAGMENMGSQPEVSLAGMAGFGSSAMGFAEGGVAGLFQQYAQGGAVSPITEEALTAMRNKVINDYGFDPVDIALEEDVEPNLYLRVMYTENRGRQGPVSSAGAIGLMQLMPGTAEELGVDPNNPLENARGGARYLRQQLNEFKSVPLALAAYNAGPGRVRRYGGVPPIEETLNYVAQIYGVDTGESLPSKNDFYTRVPGEDPPPSPTPQPADLGTTSYVPPSPVASEFLMSGVGSVFAPPQEQEKTPRPYIPNIMRKAVEEEGEQKSGIEFYKQYAPYTTPQ